ncbi:hypothetical protein J1605_006123 [Eschrichtius robustus]|uniref:Uncharacterized protein n=1 Tax=Eschrichtius robustus TaxID=9764 RepID=A0AB34H7F1_ESCRO|nr:hypothetical protein J1605_006123 [Eschrichtius robustus]
MQGAVSVSGNSRRARRWTGSAVPPPRGPAASPTASWKQREVSPAPCLQPCHAPQPHSCAGRGAAERFRVSALGGSGPVTAVVADEHTTCGRQRGVWATRVSEPASLLEGGVPHFEMRAAGEGDRVAASP